MSNDHEAVVSFGDACGAAAVFSPCRTYRYQLRRVWDLPRGCRGRDLGEAWAELRDEPEAR